MLGACLVGGTCVVGVFSGECVCWRCVVRASVLRVWLGPCTRGVVRDVVRGGACVVGVFSG